MKSIPKDSHAMAHEHMGDKKTVGDTQWLNWNHATVLKHFCEKTGIKFLGSINDPEAFELKS